MKNILKDKSNLIFLGVFILIAAPLLYLSTYMDLGIYVLPGVCALPFLYMILKSPKMWIYTLIVSYPLFSNSRSVGLSPIDFFFAVVLSGGVLVWLFAHVLIYKKKLVRNLADWMILFFFVALLGNSVLAMMHEVLFVVWFAEYLLALTILLYFPIRELFSEPNDMFRILGLFAAMLTVTALHSFYQYYLGLSNLEYAYQLAKTDRLNLTAYTVGAVFGLVLIFYQNNAKTKFLLIGYTSIILFALIFSLARTNWVILILDSALLFTFLPFKKKIDMVKIFSTFIIIATIGLFTLLGDYSDLFIMAISKRFQSTTKGRKDVSLQSRAVEYKKVFAHIKEFPIGGNGLGKKIMFQNPITQTSLTTHNIHNGYFYLLYRTGIPMTLLYLYFFFAYTMKSFFMMFRLKGIWRGMALAAFLAMLSIAIANIMSAQFFYRDGFFGVLMTVAVIGIIEHNNPIPSLLNHAQETSPSPSEGGGQEKSGRSRPTASSRCTGYLG